jgi:polyisoprenoid-binding protein YceI
LLNYFIKNYFFMWPTEGNVLASGGPGQRTALYRRAVRAGECPPGVGPVLAGQGGAVDPFWVEFVATSTVPNRRKDMSKRLPVPVVTAVLFAVVAAAPARAADEYAVDPMHTGVNFKIAHLGLSWTYGRFNDFSGSFAIDPDLAKCSFSLTIQAESIDTNNAKRDEHLRSPDFFNAKQFPRITFQSTAVKAIKDGYEVTGDLTLHGVTRSVTFPLVGGRKAEFPKRVERTGFSAEWVLKRSDFGMTKFIEAVGDEVHIAVSFEGTKK